VNLPGASWVTRGTHVFGFVKYFHCPERHNPDFSSFGKIPQYDLWVFSFQNVDLDWRMFTRAGVSLEFTCALVL
jgi:hypothetical protein